MARPVISTVIMLLVVSSLPPYLAAGQEMLPSGANEVHEADTAADEVAAELEGVMVLRVSERFLKELFARDINKRTPITRVVLGTRARGTAHTRGRAEVDTKPDKDDAAFHIRITGTTTAQTVGYNGPAIIHSRSITHWVAVKTIRFDGQQFTTSPGTITTQHCIQPLGASSSLPGIRGRIVSRIAARRAVQYNHMAERITARDTRQRVLADVDRVVDGQIEKLNQGISSRPLLTMLLPKLEDVGVQFSTSSKCINISFAGENLQILPKALPIGDIEPGDTELWFQTALITGAGGSIPEIIDDAGTWLVEQLPGLQLPGLQVPGMQLPSLTIPGIDLASKSGVLPLEIKIVDGWVVVRPQGTRLKKALAKRADMASDGQTLVEP